MTVFSLMTDVDGDYEVRLYLNFASALEAVAREFLGESGEALDTVLSLLHAGNIDAAVEALHEDMIEQNGACGCYRITEHNHPWVFECEAPCGACGHSRDDHESDEGTGKCWHGSGSGNTCSCDEYEAIG